MPRMASQIVAELWERKRSCVGLAVLLVATAIIGFALGRARPDGQIRTDSVHWTPRHTRLQPALELPTGYDVAIAAVDGRPIANHPWIATGPTCRISGVARVAQAESPLEVGLAAISPEDEETVCLKPVWVSPDSEGIWEMPLVRLAEGGTHTLIVRAVLLDKAPPPGTYTRQEWSSFELCESPPVVLLASEGTRPAALSANCPFFNVAIEEIDGSPPDVRRAIEVSLPAWVKILAYGHPRDLALYLVVRASGDPDNLYVLHEEARPVDGQAGRWLAELRLPRRLRTSPRLEVAVLASPTPPPHHPLTRDELAVFAMALSTPAAVYVPRADPNAWAVNIAMNPPDPEALTQANQSTVVLSGSVAGLPNKAKIWVLSSPGDSGVWFGPAHAAEMAEGGQWSAEAVRFPGDLASLSAALVAVASFEDLSGRTFIEQGWRRVVLGTSRIYSLAPVDPTGTNTPDSPWTIDQPQASHGITWIGKASHGRVRGQQTPAFRGWVPDAGTEAELLFLAVRPAWTDLWDLHGPVPTDAQGFFTVPGSAWPDVGDRLLPSDGHEYRVVAFLSECAPPVLRADETWWRMYALSSSPVLSVRIEATTWTRFKTFFSDDEGVRWERVIAAVLLLLVAVAALTVGLAIRRRRSTKTPSDTMSARTKEDYDVHAQDRPLAVLLALVGLTAMYLLWPFYAATVNKAVSFGAPWATPAAAVSEAARGLALVLMIFTAVAGVLLHLSMPWLKLSPKKLGFYRGITFALPAPILWVMVGLMYAMSLPSAPVGFVLGFFLSITETGIYYYALSLWRGEKPR